ncbi:hypothetical protein Q5P01_000551 [Channa striata]|uniref:Uncharacterized protein n=1 Tax=Channa striata TaxID=64152 RepID=A0AA88LJB9_CHASR|nr:hypothetical protein Q5P01_000551 [Channa striata]
MIPAAIKQTPTVGDLCVRLAPLTARSDEYALIVDLYNTYCVKGSAQMAARCISSYLGGGAGGLHVPAIPIHVFVSEWNRSLKQFHDLIRSTEESLTTGRARAPAQLRASVVANVTALALENVPALSEHLWFVLHCVVSKPSSVASFTGSAYRTGEVDNVKVPGKDASRSSIRLYMIAKSAESASGNDSTALGGEAGASLGLVWVNCEEELFDHLRNVRDSRYVHLGTESGNTFRCAGFCEWRRYHPSLFDRMARGAHRRPKRDGFCAATRQGRGKGTRSSRLGLIHRELPVSWRRVGPMRAGDPERLAVAGKAVFPHQHATGLAEMEPLDGRLHWWTDLSASSKTCLVGGRAPGSSHEHRPIADADTRRRRRERPGFPAGDATYPRWWLALAIGGQGGRTESSSGPSVSPPPTDQGGSSVRATNAPSPWPPARPSMENRGSTERPAEEASVEGLARLAQGDFAFKTKVRGHLSFERAPLLTRDSSSTSSRNRRKSTVRGTKSWSSIRNATKLNRIASSMSPCDLPFRVRKNIV